MIKNLRLQNFRSYSDAAFEPSEGVNIIVGPNASGKTNLLEALLVLSRGSSYKARTADMIKFKKTWARIEANLSGATKRVAKLSLVDNLAQKQFEVGQKESKRLSFENSLPVVLFEPSHLSLLTGQPQKRRDYMDDLLEQLILGFGKARRDYKKTLAQRNNLLKKGRGSEGQLFAWDVRLGELGSQIHSARQKLIDNVKTELPPIYQKLSLGRENISAHYSDSTNPANYQTRLLKKLEDARQLDYLRGFTGHGPHREDMIVQVDGHAFSDVASRGEVRTLVLALKILELTMLEKLRDQKPLLLLDDVFSELDGARRKALTSYLKNYQTFITTTDADVIVHSFAQKSNVIPL